MDYLTWTYFYRRLLMNPSYYQLEDTSLAACNKFLSNLVDNTLLALQSANCIAVNEEENEASSLW